MVLLPAQRAMPAHAKMKRPRIAPAPFLWCCREQWLLGRGRLRRLRAAAALRGALLALAARSGGRTRRRAAGLRGRAGRVGGGALIARGVRRGFGVRTGLGVRAGRSFALGGLLGPTA